MNAAKRIGVVALIGLLLVTPLSGRAANRQADESLRRGVDWLLAQQDEDGGWRSATYGSMRGGAGGTALVLDALANTPEPLHKDATKPIDIGLRFLLSNLDDAGFVRAPDGSSDYPIYATALALTVLERRSTDKWSREREQMRAFLLDSQQEGGWPLTGGYDLRDDTPTVSTTRLTLEALRASGKLDDKTRDAALKFLTRCQNTKGDGGFFFAPLPDHPLNKAGWREAGAAHSYGSATADGLLALLACGVPLDDDRVRAATGWLQQHRAIEVVPGFTGAETQTATAEVGLRFYYYAALASVIHQTPGIDWSKRREALLGALLRLQATDGSWRNPVASMREDDPLVATPFAILAISLLTDPASD